jgi:uncharacterized membrane protein required for colicin V production
MCIQARRVAGTKIMNFLKGGSIPVSWVDFVTIIVLCVGFVRGRKRGLSEELLDTLQWIIIVVAGAFAYRHIGALMNQRPVLSLVTYYLLSYILVALVISAVFIFFKKRFGQKLVESDIFGRFEFYGGMAAGSVRWLCMYFFVLSMLHAPQYTEEELAERRRRVEYNFGSDFFPSIDKTQAEVFKVSLTGQAAEKYLGQFLLDPTSQDSKPLRGENSLAKRRERAVDDAFGSK